MKHTVTGLALAFSLVAGLGCGKPKPATPTAPAGPTCDAVADHMRDEMARAAAEGATDISQLLPVFRRVVAERCTADAWSADARACMGTATVEAMNACEDKFTAEQMSSMDKAVDAAFTEAVTGGPAESRTMSAPGGGAPPPDGTDPCGGDE